MISKSTGAFVTVFGMWTASNAMAADILFVNKVNADVTYEILHADPKIKTGGRAKALQTNSHFGLQGYGDRAIVVWDRNGKLLFAGEAAQLQRGSVLQLTFHRLDRKQDKPGAFPYHVSAALRFK